MYYVNTFPSSYFPKCPVKINKNSSMHKIQLYIFLNLPRPSDVFKFTICLIWLRLGEKKGPSISSWYEKMKFMSLTSVQCRDTKVRHTHRRSPFAVSILVLAVFLMVALSCPSALLNQPHNNQQDTLNKRHSQEHVKNVLFHFSKQHDIIQSV